jgi:hypothetical protein
MVFPLIGTIHISGIVRKMAIASGFGLEIG